GAAKDLERLAQDADRADLFVRTLGTEAAQVAAELAEVEAWLREERAGLAGIEAGAAAADAEVARLLAAIDADAAAETERGQAFLQAQVDLAGLAGRIDAAESELGRLEADQAEIRTRIAAGETRSR